MRVLQIVQKPQRRGAEIFAYQLTQELRRKKQDVRIVYLYSYEGKNGLPSDSRDEFLNSNEKHIAEILPGINPGLMRRLQRVISDFKPEVVQANGARTVKYGSFARRLRSSGTWVLIYRNIGNPMDWTRGWARRFFYRKFVMPQIDGVVGVSQTTLQSLIWFYQLSIPTVHIPRGVEISNCADHRSRSAIREQFGTPLDAVVVLFAGSLSSEKRPDRFLRIVRKLQLQLPQLHAWVAGDGPLKLELEELVRSMGLDHAVHFLGIQTDMDSVLHASDLLLLTSDTEGIPGIVLEAGSHGVPVVATSVGGVHECVLDGQTGFLLDRNEEDRMSQIAFELLMNPDRRKEIGQFARNWIQEHFEIQKIASKYLDFYDRVLRRSGTQR